MKHLFCCLCLIFCFQQLIIAQCSANICTENGYDLPPIGQVGVLIIFAEWEDNCNNIGNPNWPAGELPLDVVEIYQDSDAFSPPASEDKVGQHFWDASFGQLRVFTDYYSEVITVPCGSGRGAVLGELQNQVAAGNPNFLTTSEGRLPSYFDGVSGETNHGLLKDASSNDIIDAVAIIWRNNNAGPRASDCSGFAFTDVFNVTIPFIENGQMTQRATRLVGDWRDTKGNCPNFLVEFMHPLFGENNWHAGSGAGTHTLSFPHGGYGMNMQGNASSYAACGWDRFMLGWQSPFHLNNSRIAALDENGNIVETNFLTPVAGEQTFILRDFYTTGDAIRLKLPYFNHNNNATPKNQYLWIENRQRIAKADRSRFEDFPCKSPWAKGLYAYIQIGKDQKSGNVQEVYNDQVVPTDANSLASWLYPLTAEGKYDFVYREDLKSASSVNSGCIDATGPTIPIDRAASESFPNPFTGNSDLDPKLYDLDIAGNKDGELRLSGNNNDTYTLGWSEVINEEVVFNLHRFGDSEDAFTLSGNNKIGIGTNPSSTPVYTLRSGFDMGINLTQNQINEPYENRIIRLNGISIEIIDEILNTSITDEVGNPSMDLVVKVRWDDYLIDKNSRWCGNILLQDDPNDTWQAQVIIGEGKKITLDQGTSPTKYFGDLQTDGTYLFSEPTVMTVSANTKLHLLQNSILTVKGGSTLIIEDGAEVLLENGACIVVEEDGFLEIRGNNITLNGADALISIRGTLRTANNIDFTFAGNGYVDFYENHVLEMGSNSNFVLRREPADKGSRFLLLHNNTTLHLSNRLLSLTDGRVEYKTKAKLSATNADVLFSATTFTPNGSSLNTGFEGTNLISFNAQFNVFNELEKALILTGNTMSPVIADNTVQYCVAGVEIKNMDNVRLEANTFIEQIDYSLRIAQVDVADIYENVILHQFKLGIGCHLQDVNFAYLTHNTLIDQCDIGVEAERSNVFVNYGGTISNNAKGVHFINNPTAEYLLSVGRCGCASIINNDVGVEGDNIVLDIDAIVHQMECNSDVLFPNRFNGNTEVFDICYTDASFPGNTILARGNYWGGLSLGHYSYSIKNNGCITQNNLAVDDTDFITDILTTPSCAVITPGTYPGMPQYPTSIDPQVNCEVIDGGVILQVHQQSKSAYEDLFYEDYPNAKSKYQPIANMDRSNNSNHKCVNLINIAKCIVEGVNNDQFATSYNSWLSSAVRFNPFLAEKQLAVYPNPVSDMLIIESKKEEQYMARLYNVYGQQIAAFEFEKKTTYSVDKLNKGVYILEILDSQKRSLQTEKLIVE